MDNKCYVYIQTIFNENKNNIKNILIEKSIRKIRLPGYFENEAIKLSLNNRLKFYDELIICFRDNYSHSEPLHIWMETFHGNKRYNIDLSSIDGKVKSARVYRMFGYFVCEILKEIFKEYKIPFTEERNRIEGWYVISSKD